ncbi:MAG: MoaD/ThiS family protein [Rhodocyclales bacterium]|nr:MoaD/ThiS family protein [Rhodocyclales bacterium]
MSHIVIRIPTPLRGHTAGADEVPVEARSVGEALARLGELHPGILERVLDGDGQPRQFVNIFLGSGNVRALDGMNTPVRDGDVLAIIPAVAGGGHESGGCKTESPSGTDYRA